VNTKIEIRKSHNVLTIQLSTTCSDKYWSYLSQDQGN